MSYPVFHGIKLAGNAEIQNAVIEKLTSTEIGNLSGAALAEGRIVYDITNSKLNWIKADGTANALAANADLTTLETLVDTINGDDQTTGSFRKAIADVIGAAPAALDTLVEIANALNNDANLAGTLTSQITALDTRITALESTSPNQTEVDAIETGVGLNTDGTYATVSGSNYIDASTSIANAISLLDTAIANGVSSATIPAYREETTTAATSHTINHALNTSWVDVTVWVKHDDNLWYKDIVEVQETDANNVTINLTESKNIKVIVSDLS